MQCAQSQINFHYAFAISTETEVGPISGESMIILDVEAIASKIRGPDRQVIIISSIYKQ